MRKLGFRRRKSDVIAISERTTTCLLQETLNYKKTFLESLSKELLNGAYEGLAKVWQTIPAPRSRTDNFKLQCFPQHDPRQHSDSRLLGRTATRASLRLRGSGLLKARTALLKPGAALALTLRRFSAIHLEQYGVQVLVSD